MKLQLNRIYQKRITAKLFILFIIISLMPAIVCSGLAATISWLYPYDGNWSNYYNWSSYYVPSSTDDVFITVPCNGYCPGDGYTVNLDSSALVNTLTLGNPSDTQMQFLQIGGEHSLTLSAASTININGEIICGNTCSLYGSNTLTVAGVLRLTDYGYIYLPIDLLGQLVVNGNNNVIGDILTHNTSHIAVIAETSGGNAEVFFSYGLENNGLIELGIGTGVTGAEAFLYIPVGSLTNTSTGVIQGVGTLYEYSADTIINAGTVNPGSPIGVLNVNGNYTQQSSGVLNIQIGGITAGIQYDQINVSGLASLAGTLNVTLTGGYVPSIGSTFPIVLYGSRSGVFTTVNLPSLPPDREWDIVAYNANDITLTVVESENRTLTVNKAGTGGGTVTSTPTGINCGTACSAVYSAGQSVNLYASPNPNSTFAGWSSACSGTTSPTTVSMDTNKTCTANFNLITYSITTISGANGTIACSPNPVPQGQDSTCTVTPNFGYSIDTSSVTVDGSPATLTNNRYTFLGVTTSHTIEADFFIKTYNIITFSGTNGSITCSPNPVNHGGSTTCTVTPNEGYQVDTSSVRVDGSPATLTNGQYIFSNVTSTHTIAANFGVAVHTLTVNKDGTGSGTVTGTGTYSHNTTATVTAVAGTGSTFTGWSGDCTGNSSSTTVFMDGNKTCTATFTLNTYTVYSSSGEHGHIEPSIREEVPYHTNVSFTIIPDDGYHIESVSGCSGTMSASGTSVGSMKYYSLQRKKQKGWFAYGIERLKKKKGWLLAFSGTYTTGPITGDCTVSATFAPDTYTIATTPGANGMISCSPNPVNHGQNSICTVIPNTGYEIDIASVIVDGSPAALDINSQYTFSNVIAAHYISANFLVKTYTIATNAGENGTITCTPNPVNHGGSSTCTVTPDELYLINPSSVTVDGSPASLTDNQYTFSNVTGNHNIGANFILNTHTVSTIAGEHGSISCDPNPVIHTYNSTCTVMPDSGYEIDTASVQVDGAPASLTFNQYTFTNVVTAHSIEAGFLPTLFPNIVASTTSIDFGPFTIGGTRPTEVVTVTNTGQANLIIGIITITGTDSGAFGITSDTCSGQTIAPSGTCGFTIDFQPTTSGQKGATLSIPSNDPDTPIWGILLSGTGCTYSIAPTSASYPFGGGSGSILVTAGEGCPWTAGSGVSWVSIVSGSNGIGSGAVGYTVSPNGGAERIGTLTIAGQSATITQEKLTYTVSIDITGNGTVTSDPLPPYDPGTMVSFYMNPGEGYRVADVIVDGVSIGAVLEATFGAIAGNHSIEVIFEPI